MKELYIAILICAFLLGIFSQHEVSESRERYKKLEKRFNELAVKTGNPELAADYLSEKDMEEIRELKRQGKNVRAIKHLRTLTEMELIEAKQFVDRL